MTTPHLPRRWFIWGATAFAVARPATAAIPASNTLKFEVMRKGSSIGTHSLTFAREGSDLQVNIAVDIAVGIGPIKLYRYTLRAQENWRRNILMTAQGDADDNGRSKFMRAARQNGQLNVEGTVGGKYTAPENSLVASHWNKDELRAPMIDLQDAELLDFKLETQSRETLDTLGKQITTTRYNLRGPASLDLWYDTTETWSALRTIAAGDGSVIEYRRVV